MWQDHGPMRTISILYFSSFSAGSCLVSIILHRLPTAIFAPQCHQEDMVVPKNSFIYIFFFYLLILKGAGKILFCGNPVQAIRARREKLRVGGLRWRKETKKFLHLSEKTACSLSIRYQIIPQQSFISCLLKNI